MHNDSRFGLSQYLANFFFIFIIIPSICLLNLGFKRREREKKNEEGLAKYWIWLSFIKVDGTCIGR